MTQLPAHVLRQLETAGHLNPDGIGLPLRPTKCPTCHAPVLRCLDHAPLGLAVTVDATETTPLGEALALALNRATYHALLEHHPKRGNYWTLHHRNVGHLRRHPPAPLFVEHRCGLPPPAIAATRFPPHRPTAADHSEPPF